MSDDKKFGLWLNRKSGKDAAPAAGGASKNVTKRWLIVGGALGVFAVVASSILGPSNAPLQAPQKKDPNQVVDMTPKSAERDSWQRQSQSQIQKLDADLKSLKSDNDHLKTQLDDMRKNGGVGNDGAKGATGNTGALPGVVPPPVGPGSSQPSVQPIQIPPPPPVAPSGSKSGSLGSLPPIDGVSSSNSAEPLAFKPEKKSSGAPSGGTMSQIGATAGKAMDTVKASINYRKNPYSGLLPAGAFAPIALLNGLDAGTSVANQSNPQPVLMQIQDNATLPGAANYKLKSCFALGSAYGDLSAERVYVRLARLSCVDKANRLVLTTAVQGYVVDSDGKLGLRGVLVDRQGARLGKALLAGFAQGLSGALGTAQGTTTTSALGAATSLTGTGALQASGLSGASSAANQLAQFYLKEAQSIFPVITVDTGRTGTLVFSDSVALKWGEGDPAFTKEVTPQ